MGPFNAYVQLLTASLGPINYLEAAANALIWAHFNVHVQLLIASLGPIISLRAVANTLGWAHLMLICS